MSRVIDIHTTHDLSKEDLFAAIQIEIPSLKGIIKSDEGLYFYAEGTSIRGIDFLKTTNGYEITINSLSSKDDYKIVAIILKYFRIMQQYGFFSELTYFIDDEPMDSKTVWFQKIEEDFDFAYDANIIKMLCETGNTVITFAGPTREAHIGPYTLKRLGAGKQGWVKRLHAHLLKLFYKLPENQSDNVMVFNNNQNKEVVMKLIDKEVDYILGKYDYLCFLPEGKKELDDMLVITHETLNKHLPMQWERIDDYTIVAPGLNNTQQLKLIERLKSYDCKGKAFGNE